MSAFLFYRSAPLLQGEDSNGGPTGTPAIGDATLAQASFTATATGGDIERGRDAPSPAQWPGLALLAGLIILSVWS